MSDEREEARRSDAAPPAPPAPETASNHSSAFDWLPRPHLGWRVAVSVVVLAACIWFFMRLDLRATWRTLLAANFAWLLVAALVNLVVHQGLKALRWYLMIAAHSEVPFRRVYLYTLAGNAASHALPARAGEALRAGFARQHGVPLTTSAGVQVWEAAIETASLIVVTLPLPWKLELSPAVRDALRGLYLAGAAIAVLTILLAVFGHRAGKLLAWLRRGASALRSTRVALIILVTTLVARFVDAGILLMTLHAVGLSGNVWSAFLVILAVDAALILPTTPGGIGGFEAACVGALHLLGKDPEQALAFGIAYHAIQQIPGMIAGAAVILWVKPAPPSAATSTN